MSSLRRLAIPAALTLLAACSDSTGPEAPALRVVIEDDSAALRQGGTFALRARVVDRQGVEVPGAQVRWRTRGDAVGIDGGTLLARAPGAAVVVASVEGGESDSLPVDVFGHPEGRLVDRVPLGFAPFGVAVSRQGVALVTQAWGEKVARLSVDPLVAIASIDVGVIPTAVAFDPGGRTAYVTNQWSRSVGVIDVSSGRQVATIPLRGDPFVVTVSADGATIYATQSDGWVFAIGRETLRVVDSVHVGHAPNGFALHPDGTRLYVSSAWGATIAEVDMATNRVLRTFEPGGMPQGIVVSPDGGELYAANEEGWLDVYELASGERTARVPTAGGGFGIALSPDEAHVYVSLSNAGKVDVVNLAARRVTISLDVGGTPRRIAFDHHGRNAIVANEAGWVDLVR